MRGRDQVRLFNRRISNDTVIRSYIVIVASLILVVVSTLIAYTSFAHSGGQVNSYDAATKDTSNLFMSRTTDSVETYVTTPYSFNELIFETTSAFGTTGLSAGITGSLSLAAKITLIFVMFIGQMGVSSTLLVGRSRNTKARHYNFIEEDITTG